MKKIVGIILFLLMTISFLYVQSVLVFSGEAYAIDILGHPRAAVYIGFGVGITTSFLFILGVATSISELKQKIQKLERRYVREGEIE